MKPNFPTYNMIGTAMMCVVLGNVVCPENEALHEII